MEIDYFKFIGAFRVEFNDEGIVIKQENSCYRKERINLLTYAECRDLKDALEGHLEAMDIVRGYDIAKEENIN